MKKILVPTDFSNTARDAFKFALDFSTLFGEASIDVVHAYLPDVVPEHPGYSFQVGEIMKVKEEHLKEFTGSSVPEQFKTDFAKVEIQNKLLIGFPTDEIVNQSEGYDFLIMGTTGEHDILDKLFGSVSSSVAQRANCPVLLIPKSVRFQKFEHLLYATNYESADDDALEALVAFNKPFNANIHFIHIKDPKENFKKTREEIFSELFEEGNPTFTFEIEELESHSVLEGINKYTSDHTIDLIVMVSHRRNFWDKLFHKSQTKEMVLNAAQTPILVFHLSD